MEHAAVTLETRRIRATSGLDRKHRSAFGQFFTPVAVARYMASLLDFKVDGGIHLLDPGAGIGSLTDAAAHHAGKQKLKVTCYELEPRFHGDLKETLGGLRNVSAAVENRDFIEHAVTLVATGKVPGYTHAILNPPYKKINAGSPHRLLMSKLGLETSNLYACFLACTIALCKPGAQVVAIIPRSFMNGLYFKPFRYWLLGHVAITNIHVFDSRDQAFSDDDVLQENVILRMVVGRAPASVEITASHDQHFSDLRRRTCEFSEVVTQGDEDLFIHVPTLGAPSALPGQTLRELGLDVCTGPVVDFRLREHLRQQPDSDTVPLLYSSHFTNGQIQWPKEGRKPNAIARNAETERWLMKNGCYVVLRRFSSKEEKRRVVAYVLNGRALPGDLIGFENHLNVIHQDKHGLPERIARGLAAYLNSQAVDDYFRTFSGHTQVNATDLRRMKYPGLNELEKMGEAALG
ncbi:MAG: Eco57I restriction-modification methylase domain-containing protein [Stenotrophobium sp.]